RRTRPRADSDIQSRSQRPACRSPAFFIDDRHAGRMKIDKAGAPFIAGALVPAALLAGNKRYAWAAGFAALGAFFAYFFRDPERVIPVDDGLVVAPADGRVMIAGPADERWSPPGEWQQIT